MSECLSAKRTIERSLRGGRSKEYGGSVRLSCKKLKVEHDEGYNIIRFIDDVDKVLKKNKVASFEELLQACVSLEVKFMICEMGLRALEIDSKAIRSDIPIKTGGLVTFFNDASANGQMIII